MKNVLKPEVLYAINCFYTAISNQCIYMVKNNVENTIKEYSTMAWDVKENTDNVKPIKKWDHTFDSDKYALFSSGWIYDLELID